MFYLEASYGGNVTDLVFNRLQLIICEVIRQLNGGICSHVLKGLCQKDMCFRSI